MKRTLLTLLLAALLCLSLTVSASAASDANLYDEAGLLASVEEAQVTEKLAQVSDRFHAQIAVMTVDSAAGGIDSYIENAYDNMNMGYGEKRDGVLLLVCMDDREYRILSNGYAGEAIDLSTIDAIGSAIASDLSDAEYVDAFITFADRCGYYLDGYLNGFPFQWGKNLVIALVAGIVAGIVVALVLRGQLKTVRQQKQANAYIKPGSMQITESRDLFLYRELSRTAKESKSSSGSGSSRNVGGGSF